MFVRIFIFLLSPAMFLICERGKKFRELIKFEDVSVNNSNSGEERVVFCHAFY